MKNLYRINDARHKLRERMKTPGLSELQRTLLAGMLNALVWVADGPDSSTMDRLLSDEPMAPGKDPSEALETLEALSNAYTCPKCGGPMAHSRLRGRFCMTCR